MRCPALEYLVRDFDEQDSNILKINWRRGLLRVWLLLSGRMDHGAGSFI